MHIVLKLAQLRLTGFAIKMPDERRPRKSALKVARSQSLLKDLNIQRGSWEQATQNQPKRRRLIINGGADYDE